jgi:hypothetical protein
MFLIDTDAQRPHQQRLYLFAAATVINAQGAATGTTKEYNPRGVIRRSSPALNDEVAQAGSSDRRHRQLTTTIIFDEYEGFYNF